MFIFATSNLTSYKIVYYYFLI